MNGIESIVMSVIAGLGGAAIAVGGLAAWLGSIWKGRIDRREDAIAEVDVDLRSKRVTAYQELWSLTSIVPKWPHNPELKYASLGQLSHDLKNWYFKTGGMYLSESSRDAYEAVQNELERIAKIKAEGPVDNEDYKTVRELCSILRTHLAADIQSRREAISK